MKIVVWGVIAAMATALLAIPPGAEAFNQRTILQLLIIPVNWRRFAFEKWDADFMKGDFVVER